MQCLDSEGLPRKGQSPGSLGLNKFLMSFCLGGALLLGICTQASATFRIHTIPATAPAVAPKPAGEVIDRALGALGTPYRWGGTSLRHGFDCSGLVKYAFNDATFDLPRTSNAMASGHGEKVERKDLKPGDLIFFNIKSRRVNHVAIYLGNDRFIHAPRRGKSVTIDTLKKPYWEQHYVVAKRVLPKEKSGLQVVQR